MTMVSMKSGPLPSWRSHPSPPPAHVWSEHVGHQMHTRMPCKQQAHTCRHISWSFLGVNAHMLIELLSSEGLKVVGQGLLLPGWLPDEKKEEEEKESSRPCAFLILYPLPGSAMGLPLSTGPTASC